MRNDLLNYKNYDGSVNYDKDNNILYGKVEFIKALINYEAKDIDTLIASFQEAIDDYLEFCEEKGIEPEKPFKGGFNVRVGEERHRKAWMTARYLNMNLNEYICSILDKNFEEIPLEFSLNKSSDKSAEKVPQKYLLFHAAQVTNKECLDKKKKTKEKKEKKEIKGQQGSQ